MKSIARTFVFLAALVASQFTAAALAGRAPIDQGGENYQAYYDDVLDITWLGNASLPKIESFGVSGVSTAASGQMSWGTASDYLNRMNEIAYLGVTTWRLPQEVPLDGVEFDLDYSADGTTDLGHGNPDGWIGVDGKPVSELGHMYYVNLALYGNRTLEDYPGSDGVLGGTEPIVGLDDGWYLTSSNWPEDDNFVWAFDMFSGSRSFESKTVGQSFVWPVADGDVFSLLPVPVTVPLPLIALGVVGLTRVRRVRRTDGQLRAERCP